MGAAENRNQKSVKLEKVNPADPVKSLGLTVNEHFSQIWWTRRRRVSHTMEGEDIAFKDLAGIHGKRWRVTHNTKAEFAEKCHGHDR